MASPLQFTDLIVPNGGINETQSPQEIKPNQWTSGLNVEPLFDGVRRRNGSTASNATALQAIVQSHEGGTDSREFNSGSNVHIAQSFQDAAELVLSHVSVRLKIGTGSPTGVVNCAIFDDSAGDPGTVVTGLDTTDFNSIASASITSEYKWFHFVASPAIKLTAATTYHVVITHATAPGTGTNNYEIEEVTTPSGYASGNVTTSTDKSTWATVAAADLNFRVYNGTAPITMIADYALSDAATRFHLVMADGELYKNVSGTLTALSDRDRLTLTAGGDILPTWGVMNDRFAFTNDTEVSKLFYKLSSTEYYENEGIAAPTAVPSPANSAGTNTLLVAGTYEIDYYYWNDDIGVASDRKYNGVDAASVTTTGGAGAADDIDITGLPSAPIRENDRVTHIRIELKEPGSTVFRLVKEVDITTLPATVTIDDSDLPTTIVAEYEHAVAPVHKLKAVAENRQFIADVAGAPYRLMFSPIIGTTPHYHSFPAVNRRDFGKGDGDYITALAFIPPRTLIVGQKNSIKAIDARRPGTSDVVTISENVGIAGSHSFQVVGKKLYFISDADENKGPFVLETIRSEPKNILGIDNTYKGFNATRMKFASCAHLSPGDTRFQWWTLVSSGGAADHDRIMVYDYVLDAWTIYDKPSANILGHIEESSQSKIYLGDNVGVEHLQDAAAGLGDSGAAFASKLTMSVLDMGANHVKKRFRWVDYIVSNQTLGAINFSAKMDYGRLPTVNASLKQIFAAGTMVWGTDNWAAANWGGSTDAWNRTRFSGRGHTFQPSLSFDVTADSGKTFHLKGISFGFQPLRNKVA